MRIGKVSFLQSGRFAVTFKQLFDRCRKFYCAVAWGTDNNCLKCIQQHPKKVTLCVVGTDFYQTRPEFLKHLYKWISSRLRVMRPNQSGTFHPKVYLFVNNKDDAVAIVGSANFTKAAMSRNTEAMLIFETTCNDKCFGDLLGFVSECYRKADVVNDDFINSYQDNWKAIQHHIIPLRQFKLRRNKIVAKRLPDPIQMTWQEFVKKVKEEEKLRKRKTLLKRIEVLRKARELFNKAKTFVKLKEWDRKALAGTLGSRERRSSKQRIEWGWFGTMGGSGVFAHLIKTNSKELSRSLDAIPPFPTAIEERDYKNLVISAKRNQNRVSGTA